MDWGEVKQDFFSRQHFFREGIYFIFFTLLPPSSSSLPQILFSSPFPLFLLLSHLISFLSFHDDHKTWSLTWQRINVDDARFTGKIMPMMMMRFCCLFDGKKRERGGNEKRNWGFVREMRWKVMKYLIWWNQDQQAKEKASHGWECFRGLQGFFFFFPPFPIQRM